MLYSVSGTFENGRLQLSMPLPPNAKGKVILTFLEEESTPVPKRLNWEDFSFLKSQTLLHGLVDSLAEVVVEERRQK